MARIVEDSDDEFPDLADIHNGPRKSSSRIATRSRKTSKPDAQHGQDATVKRERSQLIETGGNALDFKEMRSVTAVPKPRKRILNQTSDNPLLRPIASTTINKASAKLLGDSIAEPKDIREHFNKYIHSESVSPSSGNSTKGKAPIVETQSMKQEGRQKKTQSFAKPVIHFSSDEEEYEGASGLSDFIVEDSTFLDEEDSITEVPPPRSVRRLVQGRRRPVQIEDSDSEDLGRRLESLDLTKELSGSSRMPSFERDLEASTEKDVQSRVPKSKKTYQEKTLQPSQSRKEVPRPNFEVLGSEIEDPFTLRL